MNQRICCSSFFFSSVILLIKPNESSIALISSPQNIQPRQIHIQIQTLTQAKPTHNESHSHQDSSLTYPPAKQNPFTHRMPRQPNDKTRDAKHVPHHNLRAQIQRFLQRLRVSRRAVHAWRRLHFILLESADGYDESATQLLRHIQHFPAQFVLPDSR